LASLVLTIRETLRYRGAIGQWSWVLHRVTGLGVLFFLILHVIDTSWAAFYPDLYEKALLAYQSPLFTLGEFGLVACVVYHAFNGLRIAIFDNKPELWRYQERAAWGVLGLTVIVLVPVFLGMFGHVLKHYGEAGVFILPLEQVLLEQLPFAAGMGAAIIGAIILAGLYGAVAGESDKTASKPQPGSATAHFWWTFMRVSGVLILPLVFGHLAMVHIIQGVFDITLADHVVVGTTTLNVTGTATEFVAVRWGEMIAGIYIWRVYDIALLALVVVHGFNGLRYVLTDYTMQSPLLRRASIYLCTIGAAILLLVGGAALLTAIPQDAINRANEARRDIVCESQPDNEVCTDVATE
jgi:succinate dehydrogenase / fumarate reductase, cytochrome b subunit